MRRRERDYALDRLAGYEGFAVRVAETKRAFLEYLADARRTGRKVAAYGAAAKGNTFLNVCGVTHPQIEAVYDHGMLKLGRELPLQAGQKGAAQVVQLGVRHTFRGQQATALCTQRRQNII